jgi:Tol biopolymer transport system component/DNA-binding winged helix-turn-helix (wHTH) protein
MQWSDGVKLHPSESMAETDITKPSIIRFSIFELDLKAGELRRNGKKVKIQEQPFQILAALLERPGEVVTREELRSRLWPADTFVDFDHSLNAAIKRLRDALGESAETPVFVETLARRGYRFMGMVERPEATQPTRASLWRRLTTTKNVVFGGLTACAIALFFVYSLSFRSKANHLAAPVLSPVVTNVGEKHTPSLSPDGQHLAFAWNGGAGPHFSLYVKLVGTEEALRLTNQASIDFNPVWSHDGRYIAFCRIQKGEAGIYVIPALGGVERKVRETHWRENEFYQIFWFLGRLSWSSDGKLIAYSDRADPGESATSIFLLSLDSSEVRRLTSPRTSIGDYNPVFSPDGQTLAWNRTSLDGTSIYTMPLSGGGEQRLISGQQFGWGLAWMSDGRDIVFGRASYLANAGWLWKISRKGGEPERLEFGQEGVQPSIRGNRLVYSRQVANINIWRRTLNSSVPAGFSERLISSTRFESGPQFSPDGKMIAFESTRSGNWEIWMCRSDGSGPIQLTHFGSVTGTPRWSPDGRQIVFDSRATGHAAIFVVDAQGGSPRRLTTEPWSAVAPSWSRDGRWIYFASDRTGGNEVWKIPSAGGASVRVTHHGGFASFESPDGKFLYYAKGASLPGIWRIPTNGGEELEMISFLEAGYWGYWAVVENGIYYLDTRAKPGIVFFDTTSHRTTRLFDLENRPAREAPGLAVSSVDGTILYTQLDALSRDIMLVENFR